MALSTESLKQQAAQAALHYLPSQGIIGMGTGSTVNAFIHLLAQQRTALDGIVASSKATEQLLRQHGFEVIDPNQVERLSVYFDGADECDPHGRLIKGGGGAHTREKIVASLAQQFVCLIDETKKVDYLGQHKPVPVEVLHSARSWVARQITARGGQPVYRTGTLTDQGHVILDVYGLSLAHAAEQESWLKSLTGVVDSGLFVHRKADVVICAKASGEVETQLLS